MTREKVLVEHTFFIFDMLLMLISPLLAVSGAHKNTYISLFWCAFPTNDISLTIILHKRACWSHRDLAGFEVTYEK